MSTKKRIIFIHLPKCGGNSIKESFAKACKGRSDIEFISIGHMDINYYISDYHKYKYTNPTIYYTRLPEHYDTKILVYLSGVIEFMPGAVNWEFEVPVDAIDCFSKSRSLFTKSRSF